MGAASESDAKSFAVDAEPVHAALSFNQPCNNPLPDSCLLRNVFAASPGDELPELSADDRRFLNIISNEFTLDHQGRIQMPLPVSYTHLTLPTIYSV